MKPLGHCLVFVLSYVVSMAAVFANETVDTRPLILEQYWMLSGADNLQPSGLSVCGSELVMVSDRHSETIFSIPLSDNNSAHIKTYRSISPFEGLPDHMRWQEQLIDWGLRWTHKRFDWEGIHCNTDGSLYLASESFSAVAKIEPNGHSGWITPSLFIKLQELGFASTLNAGFEGITAHQQHILIALEREPRGLLRTTLDSAPPYIDKAQNISSGGVISPLTPDFTGLWLEQRMGQPPKIYTLERNYFKVCRRSYDHWAIEACWSYHDTEKSPKFRFENDLYGLAEGIARLGEHIYIVLDNNGELRQQTKNNNPLLFKFKRPYNW